MGMIDKLEAGRELDTAIAQHIMGWHIDHWHDETDGGSQWVDDDGKYQAAHSVDKNPRWRWSPSTDIKAAWRVVEKLLILGYEISVANNKDRWGVDFYKMRDNASIAKCITADASTAPLAICKAALKVFM